jgi:DNA integrity scanning protein DisA with diadenylate cyclase activity
MGSLTLLDLADIALVATGILVIFVWLRKAHAGLAALGCMLLVAVYLVARELRLEMTAWMFQGFSAVFLIILIVVLQNDLRRSFERLTRWGFRGGERSGPPTIRTVSEAAFDLARRDWGAIFVLTGRDLIDHHVEGGQELTGIPSTPLFISLFDPNSPGHYGAVIIDGDRVSRFGVHLPLSNDFLEIESRGTRHSAALGLSELTDAAAVIVSEERGEVTLAQKGRLRSVATAEELE